MSRRRALALGLAIAAGPFDGGAQTVPVRLAAESFRIGGMDAPEYASFTREPGLAANVDGTLFVRSGTPPAVAVYDSTGRYLRTIGRAGEGPGEFQIAALHGLVADTLWVINFPTPRVSRFRFDGTHVSTTRLEPIDYWGRFSAPQTITALLESGHAIAVPRAQPLRTDGRIHLPVFVGDVQLSYRRKVAEVVVPTGLRIPGVGVFGLSPFPISPVVAVGGGGRGFIVAAWQEDNPGTLQLTRFSSAGEAEWTRSLTLDTHPVSAVARSALIARGVEMVASHVERARNDGRVGRASVETLVADGLYIPTMLPPLDAIVFGSDQSIWLGRPGEGETKVWLVLAPDGTPLFQTSLPSRVSLRAVTQDAVWGTELGAFDVPYVVRFDIR